MRVRFLSFFWAVLFFVSPALSEVGVETDKIIIGMSNALSGPAAGLGTGVKQGVSAYFSRINKNGGVNGHKLVLVSYDDGYEPERTIKNTEKLINSDKVFALLGYVGTPTSMAVIPQINRENIPFIGPFTGAGPLRVPVNHNIFNVRASYIDEVEELVNKLVTDLGITKIGLFMQDDSYGQAGEAGLLKALNHRRLKIYGKGVYQRNTSEVSAAVETIKKAAPEAVVMVGAYKACAKFIRESTASGFKPRFANVSFVGTANLINELGKDSDGVLVSQVFPSPNDKNDKIIKEYQEDMKTAGVHDLDYTSVEGYYAARVLVEGLKDLGADISRERLRLALEKKSFDLGEMKIAFNAKSHAGSERVFITVLKDKQPVQVSSLKELN